MILSIIIPVYNVERYIQDCISSIYNQNISENVFEVIIVNDGTPDKSIELISPIIAQKTNTRIINQKIKDLALRVIMDLNWLKVNMYGLLIATILYCLDQ